MKTIAMTTALLTTGFAGVASATPITLDYNWNGMAHSAEISQTGPFSSTGYRSISDRGLSVGFDANSIGDGGFTYSSPQGLDYSFVSAAEVVDVVFLGSRGFDDTADSDNVGVAPAWDPRDLSGSVTSATSTIAPVAMTTETVIGLLYLKSNGSGLFDVTLGFSDATSVSVTLDSADWFSANNPTVSAPGLGVATQQIVGAGKGLPGDGFGAVGGNDEANPDSPLSPLEATISRDSLLNDLGFDITGKTLESITFDNYQDEDGAVAIFGASVVPEPGSFALMGLGMLAVLRRRRSI